tara:strand:- start:218 stop:370 length:153 start_codon:yes stop_codon:yes gene_type:complete
MEVVYTQFFQMKQFGNWSFVEAYNLPVQLRVWFYNKLVKLKEDEAKPKKG